MMFKEHKRIKKSKHKRTSSQNWSFTTSFKSASCGLINDTLGRKLQLWLLCENDRIYGSQQVAVFWASYYETVKTAVLHHNKMKSNGVQSNEIIVPGALLQDFKIFQWNFSVEKNDKIGGQFLTVLADLADV